MEVVQQAVKAAIKTAFDLEIDPQVVLADPEHGDFATNVAFQLSGRLKQAPNQIADRLAGEISGDQIESAKAVGGYVNIRLTDGYWADELQKVDANYGHSQIGKSQKVQVEFVSANPTGPLTLGNARGGFIGDVLGNVLKSQGYQVTKEYYFNDSGTQIRKLLVAAIKERDDIGRRVFGNEVWEENVGQYSGDYIGEVTSRHKDQIEKLSRGSVDELAASLTADIFENYIKPALVAMNIQFDVFTNERDVADNLVTIISRLESDKLIDNREGAVWLLSKKYGDERDRVLIKSNGDHTYLANDIAYHEDVFEKRGFDLALKVWGSDHAGQVSSLRLTAEKLFPGKQLSFVILQWVRLISGGVEVKMSKRAGTYVTVEDLIDQLNQAVPGYGSSVARFFFLMRSADTQMDFDLDLAREQSSKNPLFYVMYAYARSCSILEKANGQELEIGSNISSLGHTERELIKTLSQWPQLLQDIANDYSVHRLTFYGQELARLFHDFYEAERIIGLPPAEAAQKLLVVERFKTFMENYFGVLGIAPQQRME